MRLTAPAALRLSLVPDTHDRVSQSGHLALPAAISAERERFAAHKRVCKATLIAPRLLLKAPAISNLWRPSPTTRWVAVGFRPVRPFTSYSGLQTLWKCALSGRFRVGQLLAGAALAVTMTALRLRRAEAMTRLVIFAAVVSPLDNGVTLTHHPIIAEDRRMLMRW